MVNKVQIVIDKYNLIEKNDKVLVGVSGGPDSVCMLHILNKLSKCKEFTLIAMHINHKLRDEAEQDELYVSQLCKTLDVELVAQAVDVATVSKKRKISIEEAGREVRYDMFLSYADIKGCNKIAVAHNKNDQAETVLLNILRGTGLDGLKGMWYKRENIIRPLLDLSRSEIEKYCKYNKLNPIIDSTNLESIYKRNKVRLDLIPYVNNLFNTNIIDSLCNMANCLKSDYDIINKSIDELYERCICSSSCEEVVLNIVKLKEYGISVTKRIVRKAIKVVKGDLRDIDNIHIEKIIELCFEKITGKEVHLPRRIIVCKSYNDLKIHIRDCTDCKETKTNVEKKINLPNEINQNNENIEVNELIVASLQKKEEYDKHYSDVPGEEMTQYFDFDKIQRLIIRNRKQGDLFKPINTNVTKTIKKYFIEIKIPRDVRDNVPLIVNENHDVVWIVGHKISEKFRATLRTKRVLKLEWRKYC